MSRQQPTHFDTHAQALTDEQLRRNVHVTIQTGLLLPPFFGGTLMGMAGYYPMPEFYLVFLSYTGPYVLGLVLWGFWYARRVGDFLVRLGRTDAQEAAQRAKRLFDRLPWLMLLFTTLYSMGGALSADWSLESMGRLDIDPSGHFSHQIGLVPVVLMTVLPIYLYFTDLVGRYLAPRGIDVVAIPLRVKLVMLGIVTPLLVDSMLVGYFVNQTGHFSLQTFIMWAGLMGLAAGGTWLAWRSLRQSIHPMQEFLGQHAGFLSEEHLTHLVPRSLDEFGVLTSRFASLLKQQHALTNDLRGARALSHAVIDNAGTLVTVLDREGRFVRFNRACEKLSGYRCEEVLGKFPWDTVLPPQEADLVRQQTFETLAHNPQRLAGKYTNHWLSRDGQRFLIEWFNTVLPDAGGAMEFMVSVGIDVTQRQGMEEALRLSEDSYARAEAIAHIGSWDRDIVSGKLTWSAEIFRIFGLARGAVEVSLDAFYRVVHPDDRQPVTDAVRASLEDPKRPFDIRHRVVRPDGEIRFVQENAEIYRDAQGKPLRMIGTVQDVTDEVRKDAALRESESRYRRLHESMSDAFVQIDMAGNLIEWNAAYQTMLGYSNDELRRMKASDLTPENWRAKEREIVDQQVIRRGHSDVYEKEYVRKDGALLPVELRTYLLRDEAGAASGMWAIVRDISERKVAEARIAALAYFDTLTKLPNRLLFTDRLQLALAHARRAHERVALLFIDLDKFKPVNDTYGHAVGDELLQILAQRMRECVRDSDTVGRIGGDEFVVLLAQVKSSQDVLAVANKIHDSLKQPVTVGAYQLEVSSCIGAALFPEHGHDDVQLMKSADDAMYRAKEHGRDRVVMAA
jgi:diguanylate cyclase (GGDEF)-like protein/PAS domain S-box-containing protein